MGPAQSASRRPMRKMRKPPVGSRPGTLNIDPNAPRPLIRAVRYDATRLSVKELTPGELHKLAPEGSKLWIDVQGLGDADTLHELARLFSIHPLALEDLVHVPIRPKAEEFEKNLLVVTRMPDAGGAVDCQIEQVSLIVGRDYVLTFQEKYGDVLDPVRQRLQVEGSMIRSSPADYLAYAIVDAIIDSYYPVIENVGDRIEELEDVVLRQATPSTLQELNAIRGQLLRLRRAVVPQRDAINALLRMENDLISKETQVYLRDTHDHILHTADGVEAARELVSGLLNTYMTVVSNRMNEVMKTLTIVASLFVPLTFMAGIYGMNFEHMPELSARWAYPALLAAMGVTAIGMLGYFWRKGWIGGSR